MAQNHCCLPAGRRRSSGVYVSEDRCESVGQSERFLPGLCRRRKKF